MTVTLHTPPRATPPIPTSNLALTPFTPSVQDADRYEREKTEALGKRGAALERRRRALVEQTVYGDKETLDAIAEKRAIDQDQALLDGEYETMRQKAAEMRARYPKPMTFFLTVPTSVEREQINSRLITLGLNQVTQEEIRATMIEELYAQDWTPPGAEPLEPSQNEAHADSLADFLDSVWLRQEAHDAAITQWQEQEVERVIDEMEGAPARERAEPPVKIITVREGSRLQLLVNDMMARSERLRALAARQQDFARQNSMMLVRMHVAGVEGFTPTVPLERHPRLRALSAEAVDALREQIDDATWHELVTHIDSCYKVDGGERKNSDSPLGKPPLPSGSTEASGDTASSDGSSTNSSTTHRLVDESVMTIDRSSTSISGSSETPALKVVDPSPTDAE